jgi:recombination associated protein RdgC
MGLLQSNVSISRYKVEGHLEEPLLENVAFGLKKYVIVDIDHSADEIAIGWTSFESPYNPNFEGSSFVIGSSFFFSIRIDKKKISPKVVKKRCLIEEIKKLAESGRKYLTKEEKKILKESVINSLYLQIPATPNIYDVMWKYEEGEIWFFSQQKTANEAFETLFSKAFHLKLIKLFPYTTAFLNSDLTDTLLDTISALMPSNFTA